MRGDLLIVKAYNGLPLIRRIWDEDEKAVYITDDTQLDFLLAGKNALLPVGFPREDAFKFDPELAANMETLYKNGKWDWNKLEPFK